MFSLKNPVTGLLRQQVETGLNEREKEMFVQEKLLDVHLSHMFSFFPTHIKDKYFSTVWTADFQQ